MTNFIAGVAATFIMLPFVVYLLFFILIKQITHNHKKAVQMAMDISTIFFVFSVHYLISIRGMVNSWSNLQKVLAFQ